MLPFLLICTMLPLTEGWQVHFSEVDDESPLTSAWTDPGWTPITLPQRPSSPLPIVWLRFVVPAGDLRDPALRLELVGRWEAYVDGERIAASDPQGVRRRHLAFGSGTTITLPQRSAGRILTLRVLTGTWGGGLRGVPVFGERADLVEAMVRRDGPRAVTGVLMLLAALFVVGAVMRRRDWRLPLGFALFTGSMGAYVFVYTDIRDLFIASHMFWAVVWAFSVPIAPVGLTLFADALIGTGPRGLLRRMVRFFVGYLAVLTVVDLGWLVADLLGEDAGLWFVLPNVLLRPVLVIGTALLIVLFTRAARSGNREARLFLAGLAVLFLALTNDVMASLRLERWQWATQFHLGLLAFSIALMLILQRRYAQLHATIAQKAREKEAMLRELHDGVGGLATNIHMLAELGQRSDARAKTALTSIFDLSGRTLTELRAFVQTLDERAADWTSIASELRSMGAQMVEAQGREFAMNVQLPETSPPPASLLCLNLLRIFRESLTNALKYSEGVISVDLDVTRGEVRLVVTSEKPKQSASAGINSGRGLKNMQTRAHELGGEVVFEAGPPARLSLRAPLSPSQ